MSDATELKALDDLRKLAAAQKLAVAQQLRAGEPVSASELDRIGKLDVRLATLEQFYRLRDLTRQPDVLPTIEAAATVRAKPTNTKRKPRARSQTQTD